MESSREQTGPLLIRGVHAEHLERVLEILGEHVRSVMEAHMYAETHAETYNRIARNNLTEALSHLAVLAEGAGKGEMDHGQQRDQVTHFEDHLRRAMMESFEQVAKYRIGLIEKEGALWDRYKQHVVPLLSQGHLPDVMQLEEAENLAKGVWFHMNMGRPKKADATWDAWREGADHFLDANDLADQLRDKLAYALRRAEERHDKISDRNIAVLGIALGTFIALVGIVVGNL